MSDDGIKPVLWGIDPDVLYPWTPREGREIVAEATYEGEGGERKELTAIKYGKALPGAPVILVAALLEKDYLEIEHAREEYRKQRARKKAEGESGDDLKVFGEDLISRVLRTAVKGLRMKGPAGRDMTLSGDWEKDEVKIRRWKAELFIDIVLGTAYDSEDVEGFTCPQESQAA